MKHHTVNSSPAVRIQTVKRGPDEGLVKNEKELLDRLGTTREEICESYFEPASRGGWYRLVTLPTVALTDAARRSSSR